MIIARQQLLSGTTPLPSADFIVTSDAEWDAVFANDAATLAGKTVEIVGSNFTLRDITNRDMSGNPLIIRSANASASLPSLSLTGTVRGITFSGLNLQMTGWPKAYGSCFIFRGGTFGGIRFINGTSFRHGYGAGLTNIDTAADLPEYERIDNVRTATTTSAAYPLTWKDTAPGLTGWIEFFNRGADTVYVEVGGPGVVATAGSTAAPAGQKTRISTGITPAGSTHFAVLAASGTVEVNARTEIGLAEYLAPAFTASGSAILEDLEFRNCLFRDLSDGAKGMGQTADLLIMDCDFDRIYSDVISVSPKGGGRVRALRNTESLAFSRSGMAENLNGDARDPHGGSFQMFGAGVGTIGPVHIVGNRQRIRPHRVGGLGGGMFLSDNDISPSYDNVFIISAMQVGGGTTSTTLGEGGFPIRDALVYGETIVDAINPASTSPQFRGWFDGEAYVGRTVAVNITAVSGSFLRDGVLDLRDVADPAAVFPAIGDMATATTRAEIEAAITTAAEGAGLGATATADAVDWATSDPDAVIRWENVPSGVHWDALAGAAQDKPITLPLRKVLNRRAGQSVSVGAGTEWRKVGSDGTTELQAWGSAVGTIEPDQFIQIRRQSSPVGNGFVTTSVTINGFEQVVSIQSQNEPEVFLTQSSPVGYFGDTANPPAGLTRVTYRGKFFWPTGTLAANQKPFAQLSLGCDFETVLDNGLRVSVEDGTQAAMFTSPLIVRHAGRIVENAWLDIIFDVDQVAQTATVTVNGATEVYPFEATGNGVFNTVRRFSFVAVNNGTNPLPAGVRMADLSVEFNGVLRKAIPNDAATANVDPWKLGGAFV
ncbi:MAG: hypothetical protein U0995_05720 [Erythrobacter sp.]|nr:hypothetical protein [Erythrobacter sp.]